MPEEVNSGNFDALQIRVDVPVGKEKDEQDGSGQGRTLPIMQPETEQKQKQAGADNREAEGQQGRRRRDLADVVCQERQDGIDGKQQDVPREGLRSLYLSFLCLFYDQYRVR